MRLLVGEDNRGDAKLIVEALRNQPHPVSVEVLTDGGQVLKYLRRGEGYARAERPDLVMLDLHLPVVTGMEIIRAVRTDSDLSSLAIAVFTGTCSAAERDELLSLRVTHITQKPSDLQKYFAAVAGVVAWWRRQKETAD